MTQSPSILDDLLVSHKQGKLSRQKITRCSKAKDKSKSKAERTLSDQVLTAKKLPQAVVKVTSYGKGKARVSKHLSYISRFSQLPLEDQEGNIVMVAAEQHDILEEWSVDFGENVNSRDTLHMVLSAPEYSEINAVTQAAREFLASEFSKSHQYLFVTHNDTTHPHVHCVIKMRSESGQKLDPRKNDLTKWRKTFATSCRQHGIQVEASSRAERGLAGKSQKSAFRHMQKRGVKLKVNTLLFQRLEADISRHDASPKNWQVKMKERNRWIRRQYIDAARKVASLAQTMPDKGNQKTAYEVAKILDDYAKKMPIEESRDKILRSTFSQNNPMVNQQIAKKCSATEYEEYRTIKKSLEQELQKSYSREKIQLGQTPRVKGSEKSLGD